MASSPPVEKPKLTMLRPGVARMNEARKQIFLEELRKHGIVMAAARAASSTRSGRGADTSFYLEKEKNPEFARQWKEAVQEATSRLEEEIHRRGVEGYEETRVSSTGEVVVTTRYSDACLLALAKFRIPSFGKQEIEANLSGKIEAVVELKGLDVLSRESREDLRRIAKRELEKSRKN